MILLLTGIINLLTPQESQKCVILGSKVKSFQCSFLTNLVYKICQKFKGFKFLTRKFKFKKNKNKFKEIVIKILYILISKMGGLILSIFINLLLSSLIFKKYFSLRSLYLFVTC